MRTPKFKVGDKVKVLRKSTDKEHDLWKDSWVLEMNDAVGNEYNIIEVMPQERLSCPKYRLDLGGIKKNFPEFVLQNVINVGEQLLFDFMYE